MYVTIIVFDQLIRRKRFLFHLIYWNGNKSSLLFYLLVHILYHLIFVSLLYGYTILLRIKVGGGYHRRLSVVTATMHRSRIIKHIPL